MFQYGVPDPHSGYMSPQDYENSLGDLQGTFSGIGAELAVSNTENPDDLAACQTLSDTCVLVVIAPINGSPAEAAGLQSGDIVAGHRRRERERRHHRGRDHQGARPRGDRGDADHQPRRRRLGP